MIKDIKVKEITTDSEGWVFLVSIVKEEEETEHIVSLTKKMFDRFDFKKTPEEIVRISFSFLLEKEDKNKILKSFDLSEISDYFPNFEKELAIKLKK
jgi:hypothetical protein